MFSRHNTEFAQVSSAVSTTGAMLTLTDDTLLETQTGWKSAFDLTPADSVATLDGGFVPLAWVGREKASDDLVYVPASILGNCSAMTLPANTLIGVEASLSFDATSDHISLPLGALDGIAGIQKQTRAQTAIRSIGFETEEMVWAQTGALLHALPMSDAFFQTLRFADARAYLALHGLSHNAVAA